MRTQKGFHYTIIIIIVLSVALVGLLGYTFWKSSQTETNKQQDNSANNTDNNNGNNQPATQVTLTKFTANSGLGYDFSVNYPSNWTKTENFTQLDDNTSSPKDLVTFTSPSGKVVINYDLGYGMGLGGACDSTDGEFANAGFLHSYNSSIISGIPSAYLVDYVYTKDKTVKKLNTIISNRSEYWIGLNYCQHSSAGIVMLTPETKSSSESNSLIWNSNTILSDVQNSDGSIKDGITLAAVEAARANSEYTDAKNILLSSSYKKL